MFTKDDVARIPRSVFKLADHASEKLPDGTPVQVIEVWWDGAMVATVYPMLGPGLRAISKHPTMISPGGALGVGVTFVCDGVLKYAPDEDKAEIEASQRAAKSRMN